MIIKTVFEPAQPDEARLVIRPLGIDPEAVAEGVAEYWQRLVAGFELRYHDRRLYMPCNARTHPQRQQARTSPAAVSDQPMHVI